MQPTVTENQQWHWVIHFPKGSAKSFHWGGSILPPHFQQGQSLIPFNKPWELILQHSQQFCGRYCPKSFSSLLCCFERVSFSTEKTPQCTSTSQKRIWGSPASACLPRDASATALLTEEFRRPAWPPLHCSQLDSVYVCCKAASGDRCVMERGKIAERWRKLMSRLFSRRLTPTWAGQRGRGGLGKPFPEGTWSPPLDNFSSCFPSLSFVLPFHRRGLSKTEAFVFLGPALTRGEFQGWQWAERPHTPWRGDVHHQAATSGPSYLPGWGREQKGNWGQKLTRKFGANLHLLQWEFMEDDIGKYFLLVKVLKTWARPKGSWIPLLWEVLYGTSQGWSRHICNSQGVSPLRYYFFMASMPINTKGTDCQSNQDRSGYG